MQVCKPVSVLTLALAWACGGAGAPLTDAERQAIAASVDSATRAFEAAQRALDAERVGSKCWSVGMVWRICATVES